jgi:hypothetical protein
MDRGYPESPNQMTVASDHRRAASVGWQAIRGKANGCFPNNRIMNDKKEGLKLKNKISKGGWNPDP